MAAKEIEVYDLGYSLFPESPQVIVDTRLWTKKNHINPNQTNNMGGGEGNTPFHQYYTELTLFKVRSKVGQ